MKPASLDVRPPEAGRAWRMRAVALTTLLVGALVTPAPPAQAAATPGQRIIEINFCGVAGPPCQASGTYANIDPLLAQTNSYKPRAVLVSEVCKNQLDQIVNRSQSGVWPLQAVYTQVGGLRDGCANGADTNKSFGNAILIPQSATVSNVQEKLLTTGEIQKVICADVTSFAYPAVVCSTHTSPYGGTLTDQQIDTAYDFANGLAGGKPLVFGGDLNATPGSQALTDVYYTGVSNSGVPSTGRFQEVDQCGSDARRETTPATCNEYTHLSAAGNHHKVDYIFLKQAYFKAMTGSVVNVGYSDHELLRGETTICSTSGC